MKTAILITVSALMGILLIGCTAMNNLTESVKNKNIAAGSDTWGGNCVLEMTGTSESMLPNINLWFGRRRVWYVSLKDQPEIIPQIIEMSNSSLEVNAGMTGVSIGNTTPSSSITTDSKVLGK